MPARQKEVSILWNKEVGPRLYRMGLGAPAMAAGAVPGCFVMVRVPGRSAPLLRRPFSVHGLIGDGEDPAGLEILYRVVGPGTARLAECVAGGTLDVLGPLGRGFRLAGPSDRVIIVGGGMGAAPLVFLARTLVSRWGAAGDMTVFIGAGCEADIIGAEIFQELGADTVITTDDGSCGRHCLVTSPLEEYVEGHRPDVVYACGPTAMLKCVAQLTAVRGIPCQISVETMMACGVGACLGCALESTGRGTYLHACTDGPVFDATRVRLQG